MQEEIKAILIQDGEPTPNNPVKIKRLLVNKEAEDYITNLQEELNGYKQERENLFASIKKIQKENKRLNNIINELEKYIKTEKTRLASECSHTYEDSLGKTNYVNEDIFNELNKVLNKLNELKGDNK